MRVKRYYNDLWDFYLVQEVPTLFWRGCAPSLTVILLEIMKLDSVYGGQNLKDTPIVKNIQQLINNS